MISKSLPFTSFYWALLKVYYVKNAVSVAAAKHICYLKELYSLREKKNEQIQHMGTYQRTKKQNQTKRKKRTSIVLK